jgi:hypothetical protein
LSDLSEEILLYILHFAEDTDLHALGRVNHLFHRLSNDIVLLRYFHYTRNTAILQSHLFAGRRPERSQLIDSNIMKGVQHHQVDGGQYVYSLAQQALFEKQESIER